MTLRENFMLKTVANKAGIYIIDPERMGATSGKPKDATDNESTKSSLYP